MANPLLDALLADREGNSVSGFSPMSAPTPAAGARMIDFATPLPEMTPDAASSEDTLAFPEEVDQTYTPLDAPEPAETSAEIAPAPRANPLLAALQADQAATQQAVAEATTPDDRLPVIRPELADALGVLDYRDPQEGQRRQQAAAVSEILNLPMFERVNLGAAPVNADGTVTIRRAQAVSPEAQAAADQQMEIIRLAAAKNLNPPTPSFIDKIQQRWRLGREAASDDQLAYRAMMGEVDYEKVKGQLDPSQQPQRGDNWLSEGFLGAVQMLPAMVDGIISGNKLGLQGAMAGGTAAAIAGQVGPQVVTPEEIVTVPAAAAVGYSAGTAAGSADYWYKQGAGSMYHALRKEGIPHEIASNVSAGFGAPYAGIELAQVTKLVPGLKQTAAQAVAGGLKKRLTALAVEKTGEYATQIGQETLQEANNITGEALAEWIAGVKPPPEKASAWDRIAGTIKESALSIPFLMAPKGVVDTVQTVRGPDQNQTTPPPPPPTAPAEVPQNFTPISSPAPAPGPVAPAPAPQNLGQVRAPEIPIDQAALDEAFGSPFAPPQPAPADPFAPSPEASAPQRPALSFSTDAITPEQTALATDFSNRLTGQLRNQGILDTASTLDLAPVNLDRVDAGAPLADFIDNFSRLTGTRIQFVKASDPTIFGGAVRSDDAQTIYLNADSQRPVASLIGHEYGHTLQYSNPALYKDLRRVVATYTDSYRTRARESAAAPIYRTGPATQRVRTQTAELTNNTLGDAFLDPEFWRSVQNENRPLLQKLWTSFNEWVDSLLTRQSQATWGTPQFATDLTALRRDLAKTIAPSLRPPTRSFGNAQVTAKPGVIDLAIEAYHGTPHKVDKFSNEKIGTGEGAQAYGWGLYFAENRNVADTYMKGMKAEFDTPKGKVKFEEMDFSDGALAADYVNQANGNFDKALELQAEFAATLNPEDNYIRKSNRVRALLEQWKAEGWEWVIPPGNLYTAELDVEPEDLLDWDKPISEQSEKVRFTLSKLLDKNLETEIGWRKIRGEKAYQAVAERDGGNPQSVSEALRAAGISGIRYLDGGSRLNPKTIKEAQARVRIAKRDAENAPQNAVYQKILKDEKQRLAALEQEQQKNTYNYVVFDENLIKITAENGQPVSREIAFASEPKPATTATMPEDQRAAETSGQPSRGGSSAKGLQLYHGGHEIGDDLILKRGHASGGYTGQDSGAIFLTDNESYARQYQRHPNGFYKYQLPKDSNIFDASNPSHLLKLQEGFLKDWEEEYSSKEDAVRDYQQVVKSLKNGTSHGAVNWATASQYTEQIRQAGFEGAKFLERPGQITQETDGSFSITGEPIYSYAIFSKAIKVDRHPDSPAPSTGAVSLAAEPRSFPQTVAAAPGVAPEVKAQLTALDYDPISNAQTLAAARARIDAAGSMDSAVTQFMGNAANPDFQPTAVDYATGIELLGQLQSRGRHEDAAAIADFMARAGTTQGQAIQALSLISRLTPAGIEAFASRQITRAARNDPKIEELIQDNQRLRAEIVAAKRDSATAAIVDNRAAIKAALPAGADPVATNIAIREAILQSPTPLAAQAATARILQDSGLSERAAIRIAQSITKDFLKTTTDSRAKVLQDLLALAEKDRRFNKSKIGSLIRLNREGKLTDSRLHAAMAKMLGIPAWTPEHSAKVQDLLRQREAATDPRVKLVKAAEALDVIYRESMPAGMLAKIDTFQTLMMLLNPKTWIRNIGGNAFMFGADLSADTVAWGADAAVSIVTGNRTRTGLDLGTRFSELGAGLGDIQAGYEFARTQGMGRLGSFKEGVQTLIRLGRLYSSKKYDSAEITGFTGTTFQSGIGKVLEDTLGAALSLVDRGFYQSAFRASLDNQMRLAAQDGPPLAAPTPDMIAQARMDASRAVYQDENAASRTLSGLRRVLNANQRWGLGSMLMKFTQVPGSILMRGIEFSPLGFIRNAYQLLAPALSNRVAFDQKAFTEQFSRALVGTTGLVATGYWLAQLGIISAGRENEDEKKRNLAKAEGWGSYKLNVSALKRALMTGNFWTRQPQQDGDVVVNYDWAQPLSISVAMGAYAKENQKAVQEDILRGKKQSLLATGFNWMSAAAASATGAMNALVEQPLLSGLSTFFRNAAYDDIPGAIFAAASDVPKSMMPTAARQWMQLDDNTVRETRDSSPFRQYVNELKSQLPGLSQTLPAKRDILGEDVERYQRHNNTVFNVLFNPSMVTYIKKSPLLTEMSRVYEMTGNPSVIPNQAGRDFTIEGVKVRLTTEEISAIQKDMGALSVAAVEKFVLDDPRYDKATWDIKAKAFTRALEKAATAAKYRILLSRPDLKQRAQIEHQQTIQRRQEMQQMMDSRIGEALMQ